MRTAILFISLFIGSFLHGQTKYQKDFAFYWSTIHDNFAYFDVQRTNWDRVKTLYGPIADTLTSKGSFIRLLEKANNELYNGHISLNTNLPSSGRLIPTGADFWVMYQNKEFIIAAVREGYNAESAGLKRGMQITRFNDRPIDSAVRVLLPRAVTSYDERMYEYAANLLLAGTHDTKRKITAISGGTTQVFYPDSLTNKTESGDDTMMDYRVLDSGVGYIRINNSLGSMDLVQAFDKALDSLWNTRGLIIDLRETPSGGNTTVARAIMSRFIEKELPYQKHELPSDEKQYGVRRSWLELVTPRGAIYKKPLVVLVGRWTGSMGEGIAIGFDGMKRARIAGDRMAGLLGAIYTYTLPETGIGVSVPAEKLFHVNGTPRERFLPSFIEPDSAKQLALAIKLLKGK